MEIGHDKADPFISNTGLEKRPIISNIAGLTIALFNQIFNITTID